MRDFYALVIILIANIHCLSQDSIKIKIPLQYEVKGKQIINGIDTKIINSSQTVANNPLTHFAIYGGLKLKPNYRNKYTLDIGVYFEERNHSAGNNTLDHLVFFPKISFQIIDTIQLSDQEIKVYAKAGDLWDEDFTDLLRFHNIDFHGLISKIGYKNLWFSVYRIGDLSYNIGLGLNEVDKLQLSYEIPKLTSAISFTKNSLDLAPNIDYNFGLFVKMDLTETVHLKLQLEGRANSRIGRGLAIGTEYVFNSTIHKLKFRYQYYSKAYNQDYFSFEKVDYNTSFFNFTGTQLYPLKNYYRTINQWAFFTAFQNNNIHNFEIYYFSKNTIYKKLYYTSSIDVNLMHSSASNNFRLFPAYDIGFGLNFGNIISVELTATNKHMNLNKVYQGHSLSESPFMSITLLASNS